MLTATQIPPSTSALSTRTGDRQPTGLVLGRPIIRVYGSLYPEQPGKAKSSFVIFHPSYYTLATA